MNKSSFHHVHRGDGECCLAVKSLDNKRIGSCGMGNSYIDTAKQELKMKFCQIKAFMISSHC